MCFCLGVFCCEGVVGSGGDGLLAAGGKGHYEIIWLRILERCVGYSGDEFSDCLFQVV